METKLAPFGGYNPDHFERTVVNGDIHVVVPSKAFIAMYRACNAHDAAVKLATRYEQIAHATTPKGPRAKPTIAQLNELMAWANAFLAKAREA